MLLTHIITGFFLILVLIEVCRYLFQEYGLNKRWVKIPLPLLFIVVMTALGIAGVLILSLGPNDALLALAIGGGLSVSLIHPMAAVGFFVANLLIRPWESFEDNAVIGLLPRLLAAFAIGSWILSRFLRRKGTFVWTRMLTIFTLLFGWLIISALVSPYSDENFHDIFSVFFPTYVVCILIVNSVESKRDLALLKRSMTLSLTGMIAVAIVLTVTDPLFAAGGLRLQGEGLAGNSNDLAALAVLALPFVMVSVIGDLKQRKVKWFDLIGIIVLVIGLLMTKSRAGIMAFGGACLLYLFIVSKSAMRLLTWLLVSAPFLAGFMLIAMKRDASDLEGSSDSRMGYILAGFKMLRAHPLMGVGVGNYPRFYDEYAVTFIEGGLRTAHSTWMLIASESGPLGLILFSILFFNAAIKAWKLRKDSPEWIMAILGYGITMSVLSHSYSFFPYFLIFLVMSATRVESQL